MLMRAIFSKNISRSQSVFYFGHPDTNIYKILNSHVKITADRKALSMKK